MWSESQDADAGRYSSIAALLSSLDCCEGLNDSWGATDRGAHTKADNHWSDAAGGGDDDIALLLKYTHVCGGAGL